jgi:uncharacterized protein (TIGR03437 family)
VPAGFVGASIAVANGAYVFSPSVVLQPNTKYYIYEDTVVSGVMTGGASGDANDFVTSSSGSAFTSAAASTNFRVNGTALPPPPPQSRVDLSSSPNPSTPGQSVTFNAAVSGDNGGAVSGTIAFLDGTAVLSTVSLAGGRASLTTSALSAGRHTITASYSGGGGYPAAQTSMVQTVIALESTVSLAAAPANAVFGQGITLTATVGPATAPAGFALPSGQVTFSMEGSSLLGAPKVLGSAALTSGRAALSLAGLPIGTHFLTASYSGDSTWAARSSQISLTVSPAPTSTGVSLAMASGQLTITGVVAAAAGTPSGTVQFRNVSTGEAIATASLTGGKASASIPTNAASSVIGRPIVAVYSGDATFQASTSSPLPVPTNAAWSSNSSFAPDEIVSLYGVSGIHGDTPAALPLAASLGGVGVSLTDGSGTSRQALLYGVFASTGQINFLVPSGVAPGLATVSIALADGGIASTVIDVADAAPGIFTMTMDGKGPYAGQIIYAHADNTQSVADAANPIDMSVRGDQVYLVLYGTGLRHAGTLTVTLNGTNLPVVFFGAQAAYAGLDQINVGPLPSGIAATSLANLGVRANGQPANPVTVSFR